MFQCSLRLSNESPALLPVLSSPASSASSHLSAPRAASDCCCLAAFGDLAGALYGCWSFGAAVIATRNQHVQPSARPVLLVPFRTVLPETFTVHGAAWVQNLWDEQTTPVPDRGEFGIAPHETVTAVVWGKLCWPVHLQNDSNSFLIGQNSERELSDQTIPVWLCEHCKLHGWTSVLCIVIMLSVSYCSDYLSIYSGQWFLKNPVHFHGMISNYEKTDVRFYIYFQNIMDI